MTLAINLARFMQRERERERERETFRRECRYCLSSTRQPESSHAAPPGPRHFNTTHTFYSRRPPALLPSSPHHSPLEGESLKPSRQAPAEAVGGGGDHRFTPRGASRRASSRFGARRRPKQQPRIPSTPVLSLS